MHMKALLTGFHMPYRLSTDSKYPWSGENTGPSRGARHELGGPHKKKTNFESLGCRLSVQRFTVGRELRHLLPQHQLQRAVTLKINGLIGGSELRNACMERPLERLRPGR
jgi:hypothetical protein